MKNYVFILLWVFLALSCEEIINEENISTATVIVLAPTNDSTLKSNAQINYNWQPIDGASNYELQIASPNFIEATQIQLDSVVTNTILQLDSLKIGEYEWRIRALNSAFSTVHTTNNFSVEK